MLSDLRGQPLVLEVPDPERGKIAPSSLRFACTLYLRTRLSLQVPDIVSVDEIRQG